MTQAVVAPSLAGLRIGAPRSEGRLLLVPLESEDGTVQDFPLGSEFLGAGGLEITEVSEGGSVPQVLARNRSPSDLLLLEGEEIVGARQNRVLNATVLVGAGTECRLPVSCVEHGRWSWTSRGFRTSGNFMMPSQRRRLSRAVFHSIVMARGHAADQLDVWASVREMESAVGARSRTGAMADAYARKARDLEEEDARFEPGEHQVGWVVFVGGEPVGCDILSSPRAFRKLHRGLLRSYRMQALLTEGAAPAVPVPDPEASARAFLDEIAGAEETAYPSPGLGEDLRLQGPRVFGSALRVGGGIVHLAAFAAAPGVTP